MNATKPILVACVMLSALDDAPGAAPPVKGKSIRADRELLITHPAVVDSAAAKYPGAWSFGTLVEELAGKDKAAEATRQWLEYFAWDSQPETATPLPPLRATAMLGTSLREPTWMALASLGRGTASRIPAREMMIAKVILPWQARDGYKPGPLPWEPNLANAPFRLLAIVNRMDLAAPELANLESRVENQWKAAGRERDFARMKELATGQSASVVPPVGRFFGMGYGGSLPEATDAGEGRLIFGAIDSEGRPLEGGWTVIFEYKLPTTPGAAPGCPRTPPADQTAAATRAWAQAWHRLGEFELGDHRFNEELERLTKRFTHREPPALVPPAGGVAAAPAAPPTAEPLARPPGSTPSFGQLRSSEAAFGSGREFRQFVLREERFVPAVLPMTPGPEYMEGTREGGRLLSSFLRAIQPLILGGIHALPAEMKDRGKNRPLLGGRATIPAGDAEFHWEPNPRITREARRLFSLNTCNGCHAADTGCPDGLHVHPRASGQAAKLSAFLRMDGKVNRFQDPGLKTSWVQQREMEDRAAILAALLEPKESRRLDALTDTLKDRLRRRH